jgi:hypothetical protein
MRQIIAQSKMNRRDNQDRIGGQEALQERAHEQAQDANNTKYSQDRELAVLRQQLENASPDSVARARKTSADAENQEGWNAKFFPKATSMAPATSGPGPTENMKKFGQATTPKPPEQPDPGLQAVIRQFEQRLAQPQQPAQADPRAFTMGLPDQTQTNAILERLLSQLVTPQPAQQ